MKPFTLWLPRTLQRRITPTFNSEIIHIYLVGDHTHAATMFHAINSRGVLKLAKNSTKYYPK